MVDASVDPFVVLGTDLVITFASPTIAEILGWVPDDWIGRSIVEFLDSSSLELAANGLAEMSAASDDPRWVPTPLRLRARHRSGAWQPVDVMARRLRRADFDGYLAQIHPAGSSQGLNDVAAAILAGRSEGAVLSMLPPLLVQEIPGSSVAIATSWTGTGFGRVHGDGHLIDLANPRPEDRAAFEDVLRTGDDVVDVTERVSAPTMSGARAEGYGALWMAPISSGNDTGAEAALFIFHWLDEGPGMVLTSRIRRIVDLARLVVRWGAHQGELAWQVTHDHLTRLVNRSEFMTLLVDSAGSRRAVLFCDLDNFKPVNDEFGHQVGDRVLQVVAERMERACGPHTVARLSGDEFAVLVQPLGERSEALAIAESIRGALGESIEAPGCQPIVGVSIGVAFDAEGVASADALIDEADRMLRSCKAGGKNRVAVVDIGDRAADAPGRSVRDRPARASTDDV